MTVGQDLAGLAGGQPAYLVDLLVGLEGPVGASHLEPTNDLVAPTNPVGVGRQFGFDLTPESRFLLGLPDRTIEVGLAWLAFPFRQIPVVVPGPVNDQHLETIRTSAVDNTSGSPNNVIVGTTARRDDPTVDDQIRLPFRVVLVAA